MKTIQEARHEFRLYFADLVAVNEAEGVCRPRKSYEWNWFKLHLIDMGELDPKFRNHKL